MAKQSGLGDRLYVGAYDLSGDVGAIQRVGGGVTVIEVPGVNSSAIERIAGYRSGGIDFNAYFNDAAGASHTVLSPLPTADVGVSYFRGHALGAPCATMTAKQVNYDLARPADGTLTATIQALSNAQTLGLAWGVMLTNGQRTDTTGTNPTSGVDDLAGTPTSTNFGATVFVHLLSLTGTNVIFTLRDAAIEGTYSAVTGGAATSMTAAGYQQWSTSSTRNIRRYLSIGTSGTFSEAIFVVGVIRHLTATL